MTLRIQDPLQAAALTLGSAVLFVSFFHLNGWLFADLAYREGVNWVFLPAGFRVVLVLILGLQGATGIMIGTWYLDQGSWDSNLWLVVLNGVVSGFTPLVVMRWLSKGQATEFMLHTMTTQRLLNLTLIFAAANAITHHMVWWMLKRNDVNIWVDVWPMFTGDAIGALLMLYLFKLLLSQWKRLDAA
jgi:hypothetical protein